MSHLPFHFGQAPLEMHCSKSYLVWKPAVVPAEVMHTLWQWSTRLLTGIETKQQNQYIVEELQWEKKNNCKILKEHEQLNDVQWFCETY